MLMASPDLRVILDHTHEVVYVIDADSGLALFVNAAFETVWGRPTQALLESGVSLLTVTAHPQDRANLRRVLNRRTHMQSELVYRVLRPNGEVRWVRSGLSPYPGGPSGWVVVVSDDITVRRNHEEQLAAHRRELESAYSRLQEAVVTDPLTGLKNRRGLDAALARAEVNAIQHDTPISLIAADIDHFKDYNDSHGHPAGDSVLVAVATLLSRCQRPTDTVARVGGEEFVVLLPATDRTGAAAAAERFRRSIAHARWPHRAVTASFGAATWYPAGSSGPQELFAAADRALYRSKSAGRNCVTHADDAGETVPDLPAFRP